MSGRVLGVRHAGGEQSVIQGDLTARPPRQEPAPRRFCLMTTARLPQQALSCVSLGRQLYNGSPVCSTIVLLVPSLVGFLPGRGVRSLFSVVMSAVPAPRRWTGALLVALVAICSTVSALENLDTTWRIDQDDGECTAQLGNGREAPPLCWRRYRCRHGTARAVRSECPRRTVRGDVGGREKRQQALVDIDWVSTLLRGRGLSKNRCAGFVSPWRARSSAFVCLPSCLLNRLSNVLPVLFQVSSCETTHGVLDTTVWPVGTRTGLWSARRHATTTAAVHLTRLSSTVAKGASCSPQKHHALSRKVGCLGTKVCLHGLGLG